MQANRTTAEDSDLVGSSLGPQGSTAPRATGGKEPTVGDITGIATGLAGDLADAAKEQGKNLLESAKGQATTFADQRKDNAAQSIAEIASSLRETGGGFEDRPSIKAFVGTAADGLDQLADGIRDRSFAEIYADMESFARRQPVTVGAAAVLAGFLLARFIKSSSEELSEASSAARAQAEAQQRSRARPRPAAPSTGL
jgi:hypothetical protein